MCTCPEAWGQWFCEPQKNIHNETFKQKIYMVLLDFLNISTPVVKDDYSPRKLLKNETKQKNRKDNIPSLSLYMLYLYHVY